MATVDLTTKFLPRVDEQFTAESKRSIVTNQDFTWDGAATVRVNFLLRLEVPNVLSPYRSMAIP